jgi:shikimate dehydrogenase
LDLTNLKFNNETRLVPIIGFPMKSSIASLIYNTLFKIYDINSIMWPIEIEKGNLAGFLAAAETLKIDRFTLTMPHKADIIPFLDKVDESSRLFNSVNTVKIINGEKIGCGFDGKGNIAALKAAGANLEGAHVLMLGAGSISGAIGYELSKNGVRSLTILNRSVRNAENIANLLNENTSMHVSFGASTVDNLDNYASITNIFIQCTPLGMAGFGAKHDYLGFIDKLPYNSYVFDVVPSPPETEVIKKAIIRPIISPNVPVIISFVGIFCKSVSMFFTSFTPCFPNMGVSK